MIEGFSRELSEGLAQAHVGAARRKSRLRLIAGGVTLPILRMWDGGLAVEATGAPPVRGLVDIHDGARHVCQCLIVAASEEGGEMRYEFKRATPAADTAPLDFERDADAPRGLLT
jgi:hypothetical protein